MTREELIAAARAAPTELERIAEQTDANLSGIEKAVAEPETVLRGPDHDAYSEFCVAAAALKAHQLAGGVLMERYKTALQRLSERAAKVGG